MKAQFTVVAVNGSVLNDAQVKVPVLLDLDGDVTIKLPTDQDGSAAFLRFKLSSLIKNGFATLQHCATQQEVSDNGEYCDCPDCAARLERSAA